MPFVLLPVALAAAPLADALWTRDLGALERLLAEGRGPRDAERAFFEDMVAFAHCEPLPELAPEEPMAGPRLLLRLEVARRARLGAGAGHSPTIWRSVLTPGFFRRATSDGTPEGASLQWPQEEETWPDEVQRVPVRPWRCTEEAPAADEVALASTAWTALMAEPRWSFAADAVAYHRAVLLMRSGPPEAAREAARSVTPEHLPLALQPFARLVRLRAGLDAAEQDADLATVPELGAARAEVSARVCAALLETGRPQDALAVSVPPEAEPALAQHQRLCRARALLALGRSAEAFAEAAGAFPAAADWEDPLTAELRQLAVRALASQAPSSAVFVRLAELSAPSRHERTLGQLGQEALGMGNLALADAVAERLTGEPPRPEGLALSAEVALARGDARALARHLEALWPEEWAGAKRERADREYVLSQVAGRMVSRLAGRHEPALCRALSDVLARAILRGSPRRRPEFRRLRAALAPLAGASEGPLPVALGEVATPVRAVLPPVQPVSVACPEPFSLLALPSPHQAWQAWFPEEVSLAP